MKRAKFTLDHLYYPSASVKANYNFNRKHTDTEPQEPQSNIYIAPRDQDHSIQMSLQVVVQSDSPADPYDIDLLIVGNFSGDPSLDPKEFAEQAVMSGPNILYGAARERIMSLTSRSAWGEYILPAVVFEPSDFTFTETSDVNA